MSLCSLTQGHLVQTHCSLWTKRASNSRDQKARQTQRFGESIATRGRKRLRLSFSFIFKNQLCCAVYQSLPLCSAGRPHCLLLTAIWTVFGVCFRWWSHFARFRLHVGGRRRRVQRFLSLRFSVTVDHSQNMLMQAHIFTVRQRLQSKVMFKVAATLQAVLGDGAAFCRESASRLKPASWGLAQEKPLR